MEPHWKFGNPIYETQTRMVCTTSRLLVKMLYFISSFLGKFITAQRIDCTSIQ